LLGFLFGLYGYKIFVKTILIRKNI